MNGSLDDTTNITINETVPELEDGNISADNTTQSNESNITIEVPVEGPGPIHVFIGLMSPTNGSEQDINITFAYDLNSTDNIDQCRLYTLYRYIDDDYLARSTDNTPVLGENSFVLMNVLKGEYFWKVGCSNDYEEIFSNEWILFVGESELSYRNLTAPLNDSLNLSQLTIKTANITGLPSEDFQGRAVVGEPVNWTRRILVNKTGPVVIRTFLPESADDIEIFETEIDNSSDRGLVISAEAVKRRVDVSRVNVGEPLFLTLDDEGASLQSVVQSPTAAIVFESASRRGSGIFRRMMDWFASLLGVTGRATMYDYPVTLVYPEDNSSVGRNFNIIYTTDREFDACHLSVNGLLDQTDILVLEGTNFFEMDSIGPGNYSWQVKCVVDAFESYSALWRFSSGDSIFTGSNLSEENISAPTIEGLVSLPDRSGAVKELNISDNSTLPKLFEISYTTSPPEKTETMHDQYTKSITVSAEVDYSNVTAFTEVPWIPEWMVKVKQGENNASDITLTDTNNDSLIDRAEWIVPALPADSFTLDLSYDMPTIGLEGNVTFSEEPASLLELDLERPISRNDTVQVTLLSEGYQDLRMLDRVSGNILSTITLLPNVTLTYNLTLTEDISTRTIRLESAQPVVYYNISVVDKRVLIPKMISSLPEGKTASTASDERYFNDEEVQVLDSDGVPIAGFDVYFANSELDIDLSGFMGESDLAEKKAFMHMDKDPVIGRERTLYIPSTGEGIIYLCPEALSIDAVNKNCSGMQYIYPGDNDGIYMDQVISGDSLFYRVQGLTGTGGGETLRLINAHSYPSLGGNWTVMFETEGIYNLTITPIWNTSFDEIQESDNLTIDDLKFWDVLCGLDSVKDSAIFIDEYNDSYSYTDLVNHSARISSILIEDYECNTRSFFISEELTGGHHYLRFDFGDQYAIASNYVSLLDCIMSTDTCGYTDVLHLSGFTNAHAEFSNQSNYDWTVCCREVYGEVVGTDCTSDQAEPILGLSSLTNAHVEKVSQANYANELCLSGTENFNISCSYDSDCSAYETCVASISSTEIGSDTNLMMANCTGTGSYTTKVCCDTAIDIYPENCITPYDDYTVMQDVTFCPGVYYIDDVDEDGAIRIGIDNVTVTCNNTLIYGDGPGSSNGYGFNASTFDNVVIRGCNISEYDAGIWSDGRSGATINLTLYNLTINHTYNALWIYNLTYSNLTDIRITNTENWAIATYNMNAHNTLKDILINYSGIVNDFGDEGGMFMGDTGGNNTIDGLRCYNIKDGPCLLDYVWPDYSPSYVKNSYAYNVTDNYAFDLEQDYTIAENITVEHMGSSGGMYIWSAGFSGTDLTVSDCYGTCDGIDVISSNNINLTNILIYNVTGDGLYASNMDNSRIINLTVRNSSTCLSMLSSSTGNNVSNSTFNNCSLGLSVAGSANIFYYNNFSDNTLHANSAAGNRFNITNTGKSPGYQAEGNFWDDVPLLAIFDTDLDGYGETGSDYPYNATHSDMVTGYVTDWGPVTDKNCADSDNDGYGAIGTNISLCNFSVYDCNDNNGSIFPPRDNLNITSNTILCNGTFYINDTDNNGIINFDSNNIYLRCNNTRIIGNTSGSAISVSGRENVSVLSCDLRNYTYGLGVYQTDNSTFHSNNLSNMTIGSILQDSDRNVFYNNRFESSSSLHASADTDTNHFNRTVTGKAQGNYWEGVLALKIFDSDNDGYGDIGLQYPYNQSKGGMVNANVTDYGPVTTRIDYRIQPPILATPDDHAIITDSRNPDYGWQDPEHTLSDSVSYQIQVDDNSDFSSPLIFKTGIVETALFTYYWNSSSLDFSTTYYWRVRANDTYNLSLWSDSRDFSILPTTSCTQPVDELDFGTMSPGQQKDTLTDSPPPYNSENDGNLKVRGDVYSTNLWETRTVAFSVMPNEYYQFMIGEDEAAAYAWALDSSWINMTNTSASAEEAFYGLKWENVSDSMDVHISITVPPDEPPGAKYSTTYVTCEQNETY